MGYICSTRMVTINERVHGDFNRCTCTYLLYNSGSPIKSKATPGLKNPVVHIALSL